MLLSTFRTAKKKMPNKAQPRPVDRKRARPDTQRTQWKLKGWLGLGMGALVTLGLAYLLFVPVDIRQLSHSKPAKPASERAGAPDQAPSTAKEKSAKEKGAELINVGNELLRQNRLDEALAAYKEAEALLPDDEDVYYNMGIVLTRLGRFDEAIEAYQRALKIFPNYAEAHNNLGNLMLRQGNLNDALFHFNAAISVLPDYAVAYNSLGIALRELGSIPEAIQAFSTASQLNTNYWQARFNLATMYMAQGKWDDAIAEYRAVLQLQPGFEPAEQNLKEALAKKAAQ